MGTRNKLSDLNNHLFAALERLNDEDLKGEELIDELRRAEGIGKLSKDIVNNARLQLDAIKTISNGVVEREDVGFIVEQRKRIG